MIPGNINTDLISGADEVGYQISRSLRFNSADSAYLSRTPASAGNRKTWTWSGWVKRSGLGTYQRVFNARNPGVAADYIRFNNDDTLELYFGATLITGQVFRDVSSWYHLTVAVDTTQATSSNRVKLYVNGTQVTTFATTNYPSQNADTLFNATLIHNIGTGDGTTEYFSGYLADIHFIDGQALTPSSFAETNATTGQWVPKAYTGSYGTNGFRLDFSDNSAATAAALGKDTSGNGNNFTPNNLSVTPVNSYQITGFSGTNGGGAFANATLPAVGNGTNANLFPRANNTYTLSRTLTAATKIEAYCYIDGSSGPTIQANGGSAITVPAGSGYAWSKVNLGVTSLSSITLNAASWTARDFWLGCFIVDDVVVYGTPTLAAGNDSLVDTPTSYGIDTGAGGEVRGNYMTLNPLDKGANVTLTNGNLDVSTASTWNSVRATFGLTSGKWYWEYTMTAAGYTMIGVGTRVIDLAGYIGQSSSGYAFYSLNGNKWNAGTAAAYGNSFTTNDVIGVAFDADAGKIWFAKNGTWQASGDPAAGTNAAYSSIPSGTYFPTISQDNSLPAATGGSLNAGARPFAYTAPSGFKALCDTNLPAPTIARPSTVMDVKLYTGNGSTQTISGLGFSPDLVWIKKRNSGSNSNHLLADTVRGVSTFLSSSGTFAESTFDAAWRSNWGDLTAFNSDGFTVVAGSSSDDNINDSPNTHVAWTWDAGSSTVTNTAGSITSQVRANPSAGFSIATWTLGSSNVTVGHGLSVAPSLIICKARSNTSQWIVYHASTGVGGYLYLSATSAVGTNIANVWSPVNSTVFGVDTGLFPSSRDYVSYHFAPVAGYSSFGSYTGNGSADGPFVYTGFRPRWILFKNSSVSVEDWWLHDTARNTYNVMTSLLVPNTANAEGTNAAHSVDALSNGFKIRTNAQGVNGVHTIVYAAFAENPFQYARAR